MLAQKHTLYATGLKIAVPPTSSSSAGVLPRPCRCGTLALTASQVSSARANRIVVRTGNVRSGALRRANGLQAAPAQCGSPLR